MKRTAAIIALVAALLLVGFLPKPLLCSHQKNPVEDKFTKGDIATIEATRRAIEYQFFENVGQFGNSNILFYSKTSGGSIGLAAGGVTYCIDGQLTVLTFEGAREAAPIGVDLLHQNMNYFLGSRGTFLNVRVFATIVYEELWPGINLVYRTTPDGVKHEFIIDEGADPTSICLDWKMPHPQDSQMMDLQSQFSHKPEISLDAKSWQDCKLEYLDSILSDTSLPNSCHPLLREQQSYPLSYATFLGGNDTEMASDIVVDQSGCVYVTGWTDSPDFPVENGMEESHQGLGDCFVTKLNATGTGVVFSTFIGGYSPDFAKAIEIDSAGNVYIGGDTFSSDFPVKNPFDAIPADIFNSKCFLLKLNATGNGLVYSTFIGTAWSDNLFDIAVSQSGELVAVGEPGSSLFPLKNPFDDTKSATEGFVLKLNSTGNGLNFSTFLGGAQWDKPISVTVGDSGDVYVTGFTYSPDFPIANAIDDSFNGNGDCFVTKLTSSGELVYSTFIGGNSGDEGRSIDVDQMGSVYLVGHTFSSNFPVTEPIDIPSPTSEGFMLKIDSTGTSIVFSTLIGGVGEDIVDGVVIDSNGNLYITGETNSTDFPIVGVSDSSFGGGERDSFVAKVDNTGDLVLFSMYVSGSGDDYGKNIALDSTGDAYVVGTTNSSDFPVVNAFDDSYNGNGDCFVLKVLTADTDRDKMPNWWEELYGLNTSLSDSHLDMDSDGLSNLDEYLIGTRPDTSDSDSDEMPDEWEVTHTLNPLIDDSGLDPDVDELVNLDEFLYNTDPHDNDSDTDLMPDGWEVQNDLDPLSDDANQDPDEDGLSNLEEFEIGTLPRNSDTDADTMPDGWELQFGLNPLLDDAEDDLDSDDLPNADEYLSSTFPDDPDSEDDGMPDGWEVNNGLIPTLDDSSLDPDEDDLDNLEEYNRGTDPHNNDTDSDSMLDGWEVRNGFNPLVNDASGDADMDGLTNAEEHLYGSDPRSSDGDGDGFSDLWEVRNGFDPSDPIVPLLEHIVFNAALIVVLIGISSLLIVVFGVMPYQEKQRQIRDAIERKKRIEDALSELTDSKQNTEEV